MGISSVVFSQPKAVKIEGELKQWHKLTLHFESEEMSENDAYNPFLNYRLNVTFTNGNQIVVVPGFYATDGNAAETSAENGNIWKVHFMPNHTGTWSYNVSFRKGDAIAVSDDANAGQPTGFDGASGIFKIEDSSERTDGRLIYNGSRYLIHEESKKPFLKGGTDSPENLLGYFEFDQTPPSHKYEPHAQDWKSGDPTWQNGKGKNIIGGMNYLASKGMNSVYFLTMNVQGDGNDVWPWINENERYRFDVSKLAQWEVVFDHLDNLGLMLHIVTQETENELLLDIGQLGVQRKLYYRELIARFAHHLAITWNLGEENGPVHWSPKGQDDADRKAMAKYFKQTDPYKNFVVLHTHSVPEEQDLFLNPLLGYEFLDGPAIQIHHPDLVHETTKKWVNASQLTAHQWVVNTDEIGPADAGAKPDADDPEHDAIRAEVLWGTLMAGGAGVEWYFGYKYAHNDLNCEDWRSRNNIWEQTKYALDFFNEHLPFATMQSADGLTDNPKDYVFAKNGAVYVIYLPQVKETMLNLYGTKGDFIVKWYNPRTGGDLINGSIKKVKAGGIVNIGLPPNSEKDWVALIRSPKPALTQTSDSAPQVITLDALTDFELVTSDNNIQYYKDEANGVLAIDASQNAMRKGYASARTIFRGASGIYNAMFVSMAENDGESVYLISKNGTVLDTVINPEENDNFKTFRHQQKKYYLKTDDIITISSKAATNGKIPENGETAWSRGRWNALILVPDGLSIQAQLKDAKPFEETDGYIKIEAEAYQYESNNGTKRNWYVRNINDSIPIPEKNPTNHSSTANGNMYIEALPDTRITHDDELILGENFFPIAGVGGVVSYKVNFKSAGKYYVWARAFSSGTEDNGVHVGIDEEWPESGARMQWCQDKNQWAWSSAQRVPDNHCGVPNTVYLEINEVGEHLVSFSMREDGFEMDSFILTKDVNFKPE
ncbi:DUF5060 domain-containing protein [Gelidibacter salicanalis]|uniref:DUF5060 domain-containing protein n=1 Tax=Gelidibacter salicanalis TaxID=291193 RepID=A0A934NIY6_9FLAO|nr:DUF5060 domain-containing protein [Gelidibacter salicanalis]MBJ7880649.1 DUF5060 domain-containing protein [Gelidibacter salicanalis]